MTGRVPVAVNVACALVWLEAAVALVVAVTTVDALLTRAAVTWTVPGRQTKA